MTESLVITRITHSCHLIQIGSLTVLTDPWLTQRSFYHQGEPIALQPETLPHLDAVVISHAHYDHCDLEDSPRRGQRDRRTVRSRTASSRRPRGRISCPSGSSTSVKGLTLTTGAYTSGEWYTNGAYRTIYQHLWRDPFMRNDLYRLARFATGRQRPRPAAGAAKAIATIATAPAGGGKISGNFAIPGTEAPRSKLR